MLPVYSAAVMLSTATCVMLTAVAVEGGEGEGHVHPAVEEDAGVVEEPAGAEVGAGVAFVELERRRRELL